jgi:CBS domain-containing protein
MMRQVKNVMHRDPVTVSGRAMAADAARLMMEYDIGDVIVVDNGECRGIVTDRDVVVRVIAAGRDPKFTQVWEICTAELVTVGPEDDVEMAAAWMRECGVRRLPVTENRRLFGIVSLGDLALTGDRGSVLAEISAAPPNG